jgi:hypothetical protein
MLTGLPKQCAREMGWRASLAPLSSYYLVWFGDDRLVTESAPLNSPQAAGEPSFTAVATESKLSWASADPRAVIEKLYRASVRASAAS